MIIVCVIIISCLHGCFHASWLASLLALQAECEALRAEAMKWEDDAKSLGGMQDVSTLNFVCTLLFANIVFKPASSVTL